MAGFVPYCGSAPSPSALHWNFDPVLITVLLASALAHFRFARSRGVASTDMGAGAFGWLLLALGFISPLCDLSVALFSARVTQHIIIALLAAPMIARGLVFGPEARWPRGVAAAWVATLVFAAVFWIWHSPVFYDETLRSNVVYWLMHVTTVAAALALWMAVFNSSAPACVSCPIRDRRADVTAWRVADLRRRSVVFRARVHHRSLGPHMARRSTAWRSCDVGARRIAADRLFGNRFWRGTASGRASSVALLGKKQPEAHWWIGRTACGFRCFFSRCLSRLRARPRGPTISSLSQRTRSNGSCRRGTTPAPASVRLIRSTRRMSASFRSRGCFQSEPRADRRQRLSSSATPSTSSAPIRTKCSRSTRRPAT